MREVGDIDLLWPGSARCLFCPSALQSVPPYVLGGGLGGASFLGASGLSSVEGDGEVTNSTLEPTSSAHVTLTPPLTLQYSPFLLLSPAVLMASDVLRVNRVSGAVRLSIQQHVRGEGCSLGNFRLQVAIQCRRGGGTERSCIYSTSRARIVKGTCRICDMDTLDVTEVWTIIRDRRRP